MGFVIAGDTHGTLDIGKVTAYFDGREEEYTKEDYLIICGDVGVCGFSASGVLHRWNKILYLWRGL